MIKMIGKNQT